MKARFMRRITTIEYSSAFRLEAVTVHHLLGAERLGHEGADLAASQLAIAGRKPNRGCFSRSR